MDDQNHTSLNSSITLTLILTLNFECWLDRLVKVLGFMELNRGSSPIAFSGKPPITDSDFSGHSVSFPDQHSMFDDWKQMNRHSRAGPHMTTPPETINGRQGTMCSVTVNRGDSRRDGRVDDPVTQIPASGDQPGQTTPIQGGHPRRSRIGMT